MSRCEECGVDVHIGDWPFCHGDPEKHEPVGPGWHRGFEPHVDVQLLPKTDPRCTSVNELGIRGVPIGSMSEKKAIMKEQGLQFGSQKFEERGRLYGGAATSEKMKGSQNYKGVQKKRGEG